MNQNWILDPSVRWESTPRISPKVFHPRRRDCLCFTCLLVCYVRTSPTIYIHELFTFTVTKRLSPPPPKKKKTYVNRVEVTSHTTAHTFDVAQRNPSIHHPEERKPEKSVGRSCTHQRNFFYYYHYSVMAQSFRFFLYTEKYEVLPSLFFFLLLL